MSLLSVPSTTGRGEPRRAGRLRVRVESADHGPSNPLRVYEALSRTRPQGDVYLLESLDGPEQDRLSAAVGWGLLAELRVYADRVELTAGPDLTDALADALASGPGRPAADGSRARVWDVAGPDEVWQLLRRLQGAFDVDTDVPADTFAFGFLTTLSYEAAWNMEQLPQSQDEAGLPRCTLALFRETLWYDVPAGTVRHLTARAAAWPQDTGRPLADVLAEASTAPADDADVPPAPAPRSVRDSVDEETFAKRVDRCLRHIRVGDSYQIQIGHRIDVETGLTPLQVYRRLRHRNPSPYMYLVPWAGRTVIGASPELFIRIEDDTLSMRPIAGTAPRAADPAEDARRVAGLRASVKEQAEHVMLVDLCRNDIGRVCVPGTLDVTSMMEVEPFAYVHHLVSTVTGRITGATDVWSAVCATFPAGTMTGAPKLRAMEIINEIEDDSRGIYAGALGVVDVRGFTMLALCIRTAVHDGRRYSTQASAGVVADSTPAGEWRETLAKMSATYWALTGEELLP
ncbi:anthranilate synthase component I family protein [Streptomyces griseoloalbus]|uniref:anthranilate synthase component I family protein n=1 Tax=Streptomyces griseoloalbus TaxID=67303 RepID=UPI0033B08F75